MKLFNALMGGIFAMGILMSTPALAKHMPSLSPDQVKQVAKQQREFQQTQWDVAKKQATQTDKPKLWIISAGMSAESLAFHGDMTLTRDFFSNIDGEVISLSYSNLLDDKKPINALARPVLMAEDVVQVAQLLGKNDKVLFMVSTHGDVGMLSVNIAQFYDEFSVAQLQAMLKPLGNTPTAIILSACHSGSFIPKLQQHNRIILASAASDRSSFGCSFNSENTWFIKALLSEEGQSTQRSMSELFTTAKTTISRWEAAEGFRASKPHIFIGAHSQAWSQQPIKKWLQ
jgi:hypothetical protein